MRIRCHSRFFVCAMVEVQCLLTSARVLTLAFYYQQYSSHLLRLVSLCVGLFYDQLAASASHCSPQQATRARWVSAYAFAFVFTYVVRFACASVHPLFVYTRFNQATVAAGLLGVVLYAQNADAPHAATAAAAAAAAPADSAAASEARRLEAGGAAAAKSTSASLSAKDAKAVTLVAAAYGGTLFALHFFFASHSIILRWSSVLT
jgi:hypothetical protein